MLADPWNQHTENAVLIVMVGLCVITFIICRAWMDWHRPPKDKR